MKVLVLSLLVACAYGMAHPRPDLDEEWIQWKTDHGNFNKTIIIQYTASVSYANLQL